MKIYLGFTVAGDRSSVEAAKHFVLQHPIWIEKTRIVCFRDKMQVLWNVVDEGGFEPPASSLRTRENLR